MRLPTRLWAICSRFLMRWRVATETPRNAAACFSLMSPAPFVWDLNNDTGLAWFAAKLAFRIDKADGFSLARLKVIAITDASSVIVRRPARPSSVR